jgi:hypothetical protein
VSGGWQRETLGGDSLSIGRSGSKSRNLCARCGKAEAIHPGRPFKAAAAGACRRRLLRFDRTSPPGRMAT